MHVGHARLRTAQWQYQINGSDRYDFKGRWLLTSRGLSGWYMAEGLMRTDTILLI